MRPTQHVAALRAGGIRRSRPVVASSRALRIVDDVLNVNDVGRADDQTVAYAVV
jgi:hypothetical protein